MMMSYFITFPTLTSLTPFLIFVSVLLIFIEQIAYLKKKRHVPGPKIVLPFFGNNVVSFVFDRARFWESQSDLAINFGFSANYVLGKFVIFVRSSDLSNKIFSNVRPDAFHIVPQPFGKRILGDHNIIHMFGEEHRSLRGRIAPNFSPKALSLYSLIQQVVILRNLLMWLGLSAPGSSISLRGLVRDMMLESLQNVFIGPYLTDESRFRFKVDYEVFNSGIRALPVDLPGFAFRRARFAMERLVDTLEACVGQSKKRMEREEEKPSCMIDFWFRDSQSTKTLDSSNREMGVHLLDFLVFAHEASASSLLWAVTLLESNQEVLRKVREEVSRIWSPKSGDLISPEQLSDMRYTSAVAREVVRYRTPLPVVPHVAGEDFPLTESYTIPKGTIVFPSLSESSFQGFIEPDRFDPDRFSEDRQEDRIFKRNFLPFGAGPHQCVGQRYALNHLTLFIAMFSTLIDFKRDRMDGCDDIKYVPTACPKDDCKVFLSPRFPVASE